MDRISFVSLLRAPLSPQPEDPPQPPGDWFESALAASETLGALGLRTAEDLDSRIRTLATKVR